MEKKANGSVQPSQAPDGIVCEGHWWHSSLKKTQLLGILEEFCILEEVTMVVTNGGCCDEEGFNSKVAILVFHLSHGLRLPFYRHLRDILDFLRLVPAQLHPFALRVFLCASVIFCMVLEPLSDPYPDLTSQDFLHFYNVWEKGNGDVTSFYKKGKGQCLAQFESRYLNAKAWDSKYFFFNG